MLKGVYISLVVVIWCLVLVALLEGGALLYQLRMERTNPLIAAYRGGQPLPAVGTPITVVPVQTEPPVQVGGWDTHPIPFEMDATMKQVLAWATDASGLDQETRDARRTAFFELTHDAREIYARLGKEMVLVFNEHRQLLAVYGSDKFFFEGVQRLLFRAAILGSGVVSSVYEALDTALESGQRHSFALSWPNSRKPMAVLAAVCIPANSSKEDDERACVFVNLNPDEIAFGPEGQVPDDSRWVIPHFRFKPDYRGEAHPGFTTNSLGFRDAEREVPKPEGTYRILCVGGSTTQEGDTNATTYPALLEARLREAFPERVIEVVNAGIPGIATPLHLLRLSDYRKLEPDLVIMHPGVNDTLLKYNSWLVNALPSRLRSARMFFPSLAAPSLETFRTFHREYMVRNLELMSVLFQQQGVAVAFASIAWPDPDIITDLERAYYNYQSTYTWQFPAFELSAYAKYIRESNRLLKETASAMDGIYIPVAESLHGGTSLFTDFCHMTQAGIREKAAVMFDALYPVLNQVFVEVISSEAYRGRTGQKEREGIYASSGTSPGRRGACCATKGSTTENNKGSVKNAHINAFRLSYQTTPSTVIPVFSRRSAWIEERCWTTRKRPESRFGPL